MNIWAWKSTVVPQGWRRGCGSGGSRPSAAVLQQPTGSLPVLVILVCTGLIGTPAAGQEQRPLFLNLPNETILPRSLFLGGMGSSSGGETAFTGRAARFRMFRMPAGFLHDPIGLDSDDDNLSGATDGPPPIPDGFGDNRLGVTMGADNPFFDIHLPGDPGGVGYQRVHTQCQLVGDQFTSMCFGLQAYAPAGLECDGLANGPTILCPSLALFHEWENGVAVQGFLGKNLPARAGWTDHLLRRGLQCGIGLQSPCPWVYGCSGQGLHWFVEALGAVQRPPHSGGQPAPFLGIIPGLHWRLSDNWWMSSGVVVPMGPTHYEPGLVQITWSWRF